MGLAANEKLSRDTLVGRLSAQLREQIISGRIAPGVALPSERELCEAFGVGRTTVREALQSLTAAGFLERIGKELLAVDPMMLPDREVDMATLAARLSVEDVFEVRQLIEGRVVLAAAKNWVDGDLAALRRSLDAMRDPESDEVYHAAHLEFHLEIARLGKNPALTGVYESSVHLFFKLPSFWRVFGTGAPNADGLEPVKTFKHQARINGWKRHVALYEAIAERDAGEALRLNNEMLERIERTLIERLDATRL